MATCKICLRTFQHLRYKSSRVCICGRCTNDLNKYKQVAEDAYDEARQMLERGIIQRAENDLYSEKPQWILDRAVLVLADPARDIARALPGWVNKLVADNSNRKRSSR